MPQVNIVIPTFNRLKALQRAVSTVVNQTFTNWQLTIVDDGSTDQTESWVKEILEPQLKKKLHYIKTKNLGVSHARNLGIASTKCEYIAFLDSDDEWLASKLTEQMSFFNKNPDIKIVHSNEQWVRNGKIINQKSFQAKSGGFIFDKCTQLCLISPSATIIHKSVFRKVGIFDKAMTVCEDYDLWLRIAKKFEVGFIEKELTIKHGGHQDQLSFKYKAMDYWRVKSLAKHLNSTDLTKESQVLVAETIKKKCDILLDGYHKHNNLKNWNEIMLLEKKCQHHRYLKPCR